MTYPRVSQISEHMILSQKKEDMYENRIMKPETTQNFQKIDSEGKKLRKKLPRKEQNAGSYGSV